MLHQRSEQPTLFELTACNEFEPLRGLPPEHAAPDIAVEPDPWVPEGNVSPTEQRVFRAVSPLALCCGCTYVVVASERRRFAGFRWFPTQHK